MYADMGLARAKWHVEVKRAGIREDSEINNTILEFLWIWGIGLGSPGDGSDSTHFAGDERNHSWGPNVKPFRVHFVFWESVGQNEDVGPSKSQTR